MARSDEKIASLVAEEEELADALTVVLDHAEERGVVEWSDVSDEISTGQWGRLIETGLLVDGDGQGFVIDDPDAVRDALGREAPETATSSTTSSTTTSTSTDVDDEESSWSSKDKAAAAIAGGMMLGYSLPNVRNVIGNALDVVLGPLEQTLPFYVVVLVLAIVTGLYSTLLQANLMDMDKMAKYQEKMKAIQEKRKQAKKRDDDEALDKLQEEQMEAMGDQLGMFKEQFRPMAWIMLFTIPVFLWMYWMLLSGQNIHPQTIVLPMVGEVGWQRGILGPIQAWIVWYFLCSMSFTQIIRKSLNIQTTPT
jgi:uncharacterized membrane protein (DUF106 family)